MSRVRTSCDQTSVYGLCLPTFCHVIARLNSKRGTCAVVSFKHEDDGVGGGAFGQGEGGGAKRDPGALRARPPALARGASQEARTPAPAPTTESRPPARKCPTVRLIASVYPHRRRPVASGWRPVEAGGGDGGGRVGRRRQAASRLLRCAPALRESRRCGGRPLAPALGLRARERRADGPAPEMARTAPEMRLRPGLPRRLVTPLDIPYEAFSYHSSADNGRVCQWVTR